MVGAEDLVAASSSNRVRVVTAAAERDAMSATIALVRASAGVAGVAGVAEAAAGVVASGSSLAAVHARSATTNTTSTTTTRTASGLATLTTSVRLMLGMDAEAAVTVPATTAAAAETAALVRAMDVEATS